MIALLLALTLATPCDDFAADVARRAELMAADVETMPHVVREGLRQLAHDAKAQAGRDAAIEKLREELREIIRKNRGDAPAPRDETASPDNDATKEPR